MRLPALLLQRERRRQGLQYQGKMMTSNVLARQLIGARSLVLLVVMSLGACGSTTLTVTGSYPAPLTSPLPLTATVLLDPAFRDYIATPSDDINMKIGAAQTRMMEQVLGQRFTSLTLVTSQPEVIDTDILLVASVAGVQIGTPGETHLGIYEVWIKYNLEISDSSNRLIAKWFMPAYGKTPSAFMTSEAKAIDTAAQVALRDAGVRLITDFHRIPAFHYWLDQREQGFSTAPEIVAPAAAPDIAPNAKENNDV